MRASQILLAVALALGTSACETVVKEQAQQRQGASVMEYLYPDTSTEATMPAADVATLKVPLRIGVAFVPSAVLGNIGATETQQQALLDSVARAFAPYPFVAEIKAVPTQYLRVAGGFADLARTAAVFDVDVMALLSYDQHQFTEKTRRSFWYWTLVGAYMAQGEQYDIHTLVEASIVDVKSRRLLFRAAGTSVAGGGAAAANLAEHTRAARTAGFRQAVDRLIPELQASLQVFRQRARAGSASGVELQLPPGYDPSASRPAR